MNDQMLQWHPIFGTAIQLNTAEEAETITFQTELGLNKMPMRIDLVLIKKDKEMCIRDSLGGLRLSLHFAGCIQSVEKLVNPGRLRSGTAYEFAWWSIYPSGSSWLSLCAAPHAPSISL